jgi:A/G-specific adenine glycosylase
VDGNVERVVSRLHAVEQPLPASRPELYRLADALTPAERPGDYAQAMMDLGATVCTPRAPRCGLCPVSAHCRAYELGRPEDYPRKAARKAKPQRQGRAYWLEHDGAVLLVRRPDAVCSAACSRCRPAAGPNSCSTMARRPRRNGATPERWTTSSRTSR